MDVIKKIIVIALISIIASSGITYTYFHFLKQIEIENIKNSYENEIYNLKNYVSYIQNKYDIQNKEINDTKDLLAKVQEELYIKNISLQQNISELEKLRSGNNFELHDPTYNEVINFIENDKTNEEIYIEDVFDCEQFSQLVNTNAENIGIRCAYIILYFYDIDAGHGIVGFNTVDHGMVYIEPQTDEWVENLEIGNDFWTDCIIPNGNYYYEESPNDTIKEILIFW